MSNIIEYPLRNQAQEQHAHARSWDDLLHDFQERIRPGGWSRCGWLTVYPDLVRATGSVVGGILLSDLIYWCGRQQRNGRTRGIWRNASHPDVGYFRGIEVFSWQDMADRLGLRSGERVRSCVRRLAGDGLLVMGTSVDAGTSNTTAIGIPGDSRASMLLEQLESGERVPLIRVHSCLVEMCSQPSDALLLSQLCYRFRTDIRAGQRHNIPADAAQSPPWANRWQEASCSIWADQTGLSRSTVHQMIQRLYREGLVACETLRRQHRQPRRRQATYRLRPEPAAILQRWDAVCAARRRAGRSPKSGTRA